MRLSQSRGPSEGGDCQVDDEARGVHVYRIGGRYTNVPEILFPLDHWMR